MVLPFGTGPTTPGVVGLATLPAVEGCTETSPRAADAQRDLRLPVQVGAATPDQLAEGAVGVSSTGRQITFRRLRQVSGPSICLTAHRQERELSG
jgi:hypothetical protein